ncbi:CD225/dispanin family protein [Dokdonella sp.]|uniref:CD225/dispanin family protein n=1 Tax=Dokdonella sp. TaxID=2291710 RepID=UPI0035272BA0
MPHAVTEYGLGTPPSASRGTLVHVGNNLVWAILATIFCCLPTGIVAIVYAAQVDGKVSAGDTAGARESARLSAIWSWVSFGVGLFFGLGWIALVLLGHSFGR